MANIIVVDDDKVLRKNLAFYLKSQSHNVEVADSAEQALELSKVKFFDLIVSDIRMPKMNGVDLLPKIKSLHPATEVILVTGYGNVPMAVDAIRQGAADFICKPFEYGNLLSRIEEILKQRDKKVASSEDNYDMLVAHSQKMRDVLDIIAKASNNEISVLIEGEIGTGKELVARAIHNRSSRKDESFYIIECSAIQIDEIEGELFGSWDDAEDKTGILARANGSTLFIKDIERLPLNIQTRLLRFIQDGYYTIPGKNQKIKADVRLLCSSTKCVKNLVAKGTFREDLFYTLSIMPIYVPPLRNRIAEIFPLVNHFLEKYSKKFDKKISAVAPDILAWMQTYQWPGNVAELENIIARAAALSNSEIIDESLIFTLPKDRPEIEKDTGFLNVTLKDNQKVLILKALKQNSGNYTRTAQQLGISRTTLWRRMKKFKIEETV